MHGIRLAGPLDSVILTSDCSYFSSTMAAELDPKVAALLDKHADKAIASSSNENAKDLSDDEDDLLAELERDDSAMDAFREKRMQQLHDEYGLKPFPTRGYMHEYISWETD